MSLREDSFQSSSTVVSVPAEDTVMDLSQFNTSIWDFFQINEYNAKKNVKQCNYFQHIRLISERSWDTED